MTLFELSWLLFRVCEFRDAISWIDDKETVKWKVVILKAKKEKKKKCANDVVLFNKVHFISGLLIR